MVVGAVEIEDVLLGADELAAAEEDVVDGGSERSYLWGRRCCCSRIEVYVGRAVVTDEFAKNGCVGDFRGVKSSEPLDFDAVLAAGGSQPWTGMPPGEYRRQ